MNIPAVIVVFIIWWWIAFLAVLPMGVTSRWEDSDDGVKGADPGAPQDPQLKKKAFRATVIAVVMTAISAAIIVSGIFNFRE